MPAQSRARRLRAAIGAGALLAAVGCAPESPAPPPRPSFLLVVVDTVRWDAVSSNGVVADTTPFLDGLAAAGLRFTNAYSAASWTLPSHASLFTGLLPSAHGVGWPQTTAPQELVMLAERLRDADYETVAISENPWVTGIFGMVQGFDQSLQVTPRSVGTVEFARNWVRDRSPTRPYFLFVNVLDAHSPYRTAEVNPHVPCCFGDEGLAALPPHARESFCRTAEHETELRAQHGLYLNGVTRADAKVGELLFALRAAEATDALTTIVTSDHGEHFGEHGFVDHLIGVHEELIHVPLIVHGRRGARPAVIDEPVSLLDVVPSVLAWAGLPPSPDAIGRPLPVRSDERGAHRVVVSEWHDPGVGVQDDDRAFAANGRRLVQSAQQQCQADAPVWGLMRAVVDFPEKLYWYEREPAALYDLAADPRESRDLASERRLRVRRLMRAMPQGATAVRRTKPQVVDAPPEPVQPETLERLRALGYLAPEK